MLTDSSPGAATEQNVQDRNGGLKRTILTAHNSIILTNAICLPIIFVIITAVISFILLSLSSTYISVMLNDTFVIVDGAYRMANGYVPHVDFRNQLGFLNFAFPALAMLITDHVGAAMQTSLALYVIFLAPIAGYILATRLRYWIALPLFVFTVLLVATPFMVGSTPVQITFASIYNRMGWAAYLVLLILYLTPVFALRKLWVFDAVVAALLMAFLFYTKITYGLIAMSAFVLMAILEAEWRRRAVLAFVVFGVIAALLEVFLSINTSYFADLAHHSQVRSSLGFFAATVIKAVARNTYFILAGFSALILCFIYSDRKYRDTLFGLFIIGSSVVLFIFNGQSADIPTIVALIVISCERIARSPRLATDSGSRVAAFSAFALFLIMISELLSFSSVAFALNYTKSASARPEAVAGDKNIGSYFYVEDWPHGANSARMKAGIDRFGEDSFDKIGKYVVSRQSIFQQEYARSIEKGVDLLREYGLDEDRIITFDFANPFPVLLGAPPPTGDRVGLYFGRTFNEDVHIPAETMFRDTTVVMVPKVAIEPDTRDGLVEIYGLYLWDRYRLVHDDPYWSVWKAKEPNT